MKSIRLLCIPILVLIGVIAQAADKPGTVTVRGDNFAISAMEPKGWKGDSVNAGLAHVNLFYYRTSENIQNAKTPIKVLVAKKTDENTAEDMKFDMESYRKQYPDVKFKDMPLKHPLYRTYAMLFYVKNGFHEYVTYLNPGENFPYIISVSMTVQNKTASNEEIKTYVAVVESIKALK